MVGCQSMETGATGEGSIDGLDWTHVQVGIRASVKGSGRFVMTSGDGFLLPAEAVVEAAREANLVNLEVAGTSFAGYGRYKVLHLPDTICNSVRIIFGRRLYLSAMAPGQITHNRPLFFHIVHDEIKLLFSSFV